MGSYIPEDGILYNHAMKTSNLTDCGLTSPIRMIRLDIKQRANPTDSTFQ
jgi:aryl carrier-like protein